MGEQQKSAPTGCYKCGRPGHWSRDCPDSDPIPTSTPSSNFTNPKPFPFKNNQFPPKPAAEKPKKAPKTRPKLTPELLLGDDGLGYILKYFPSNFKYHGRGHEVRNLGNLIGMYSEWHNHLIPYYPFDQFVDKVEQVAATRRVRTCIAALRERVASGGDPTKLHEIPGEDVPPEDGEAPFPMDSEGILQKEDPQSNNANADAMPEDVPQDVYDKATGQEQSPVLDKESSAQQQNSGAKLSGEIQITEEQRTRMEANRLKALERAAARARLSKPT